MDPNAFAKMVPGFDFLQSLMQSAGQAAPAMGQWIAPTLNPEELDKRIGELKTVQFWLEQNARMISVTVQALEVQRMTLSTLQTMNLPMTELRNALTLPTAPSAAAPAPRPPAISPAPPTPEPPGDAEAPSSASAETPASGSNKAPATKPAVDPMQWWGALTQQFTELATKAMQDGGAIAARNLAAAAEAAPAASAKAKTAAKPAARRATAKQPAAKASRKRA